jgi:raffinose/stachyose/melibiose transport system substrate-binding protein
VKPPITRTLPAVALLCATALTAAACSDDTAAGGGQDSTAQHKVDPTARLDGVHLTMWTAQNTVDAPKQVIKAFEKATGATVSTQAIPDLYEQNVPTKLASGARPDLMFWQPSISTLPFIHPEQNLLPLDHEPWVSRLGKKEQSLGTLKGTRYAAIITSPAMLGVYYNKAAFAKAGITSMPKSYDDLLALAGRIKKSDPGVAPFFEVGGDKWPLQWQVQLQLTDLPSAWWNGLNRNQHKWTDPAIVKAITTYRDRVLNAGLAQRNYKTATFVQQGDALMKGTAAMAVNVTSLQAEIQAKYSTRQIDGKLGWFPVSNSSDTGLYSPDQTNGMVAFKTGDAKRQDAARQFLAFWLGPDYADYIKALKIPSVEPSVPTPGGLPQTAVAQAKALPSAYGVFQAKTVVAPDLHLGLADMIYGKKTPQQVAGYVQNEFTQIAKAQGDPGF